MLPRDIWTEFSGVPACGLWKEAWKHLLRCLDSKLTNLFQFTYLKREQNREKNPGKGLSRPKCQFSFWLVQCHPEQSSRMVVMREDLGAQRPVALILFYHLLQNFMIFGELPNISAATFRERVIILTL